MKTEVTKTITLDRNDLSKILKDYLKLDGEVSIDFKEEEVTYKNYRTTSIEIKVKKL